MKQKSNSGKKMRTFREEKVNAGLLDFIRRSPNGFFAVENIAEELTKAGLSELREKDAWEIIPGGAYFVRRNSSAMIAFRIPEKIASATGSDVAADPTAGVPPFSIYAAHCDSPAFRVKPNAEISVEGKYTKLNVEGYGGMLMSTWLDRPLSVAGRIVVRVGGRLETRLVNIDRDLLVIPNLAIHMDRKANDGKAWNIQNDLLPLFAGTDQTGAFLQMIADAADVKAEEILDTDLFLYNREHGTTYGAAKEFLASPRLDDLQCVYAGLQGFLAAAGPTSMVPVFCVFDNEEVGSSTKQGAASTFLRDVLVRICAATAFADISCAVDVPPAEHLPRALAQSFMISADNAHSMHPNDTAKADPTNRPVMNGGIVIKYSANQKYATDAVSGAAFRDLCARADVPVQTFVNRSDVPGGSTLGNISNTQVALNTVDIGLAQLAMHSAYETAGAQDTAYLAAAAKLFFETGVRLPE